MALSGDYSTLHQEHYMNNSDSSGLTSGIKKLNIGMPVPDSALTPVYSINGNGGDCVWAMAIWNCKQQEINYGNFHQNKNNPMGFITVGTNLYINSIEVVSEGGAEHGLIVRIKMTSNDGQISEGGPRDGNKAGFTVNTLTNIRVVRLGFVVRPDGPIGGMLVEYVENYVEGSEEGHHPGILKYALGPGNYSIHQTQRKQELQSWALLANALSVLMDQGLMDSNSLADFYCHACYLLRKEFPCGPNLGGMIEDLENEIGTGESQSVADGDIAVYQSEITIKMNGGSVWFYPRWSSDPSPSSPMTTQVVSTSAPTSVSAFRGNIDFTFSLNAYITGLSDYREIKYGGVPYYKAPST